MSDRTFPLSRFSPAIQEMCRQRYQFPSYNVEDDTLEHPESVDYIGLYSLIDDDIPILLEITGWLGRYEDMPGCRDAPLHAWKALSQLDPILVVPKMLDNLNRIDWSEADYLTGFFGEIIAAPCGHSANEAKKTGNVSLNTIPFVLEALKEKKRHSTTRTVLSDALHKTTIDLPEHRSEYHQILLDDIRELRIDCRTWYAEIVSKLASVEDPSPELVALVNKACRDGYAELAYLEEKDLIEKFDIDFEYDQELLTHIEKSEEATETVFSFRYCGNKFPHQAVKQARELRDWIIPNLIEVVRDSTAYARYQVANDDGSIHFAVHLLAEFQAKEALPAILDSLSFSNDDLWDYLYGDGLYEAMPGILNRLIGDEPEFYDQKLRDPQVPEMLQHCLSQSLRLLVARKIISIETYGNWLQDYLEIAIQAEKKELVTILASDILDTANPAYIPIVRKAFAKNLVCECMMPLEYAEKELTSRSFPLEKSLPDPERDFSDAVEELSSWAWFQNDDEDDEYDEDDDEEDDDYDDDDFSLWERETSSSTTDISRALFGNLLDTSTKYPFAEDDYLDDEYDVRIPEPLKTDQKVGRNEPCPCGSGKKYKMCCLKRL
jgi:hypothetical protein